MNVAHTLLAISKDVMSTGNQKAMSVISLVLINKNKTLIQLSGKKKKVVHTKLATP